MKKTSIVIRTQFRGLHRYVNAPEEVKYLRDQHRHVFYVEVEMQVQSLERDLEFILVKSFIDEFLAKHRFGLDYSCEKMADEIIAILLNRYGERSIKCCVYEDNENGGCVYYEH